MEMKLIITSIADAGDLQKERVILRASMNANLTYFAVFCCKKGPSSLQAGDVPHVYWFWDQEVKKNDLIVLYTKAGVRSEKTVDDGTTTHFYYWQKDKSIWTPDMRAAAIYAPQWRMFKPG